MSYNYFKDRAAIASMIAILIVGGLFGYFYSWWVPGIAWPAFALLFILKRNSP